MKKLVSFALVLALVLGLWCPALAAEAVTPTPPEWINEADYLIFPGDEVYEPENWAKVEALREEARNGALLFPNSGDYNAVDWAAGSTGMRYETALVRIKYGLNAKEQEKYWKNAFYSAGRAFSAALSSRLSENGKKRDELCYRLSIEGDRAHAIDDVDYHSTWKYSLLDDLIALDMTLEDFFNGQYMYLAEPEAKEIIKAQVERVDLYVDQWDVNRMELDVPPEVKNQRTMLPVRAVAEAIGADVEWKKDTQQAVLTRAGSTVTMTLNSTTADVDGRKVEMDVAPYAVDGRTLLPARYVAEFFGQKVTWDGKQYRVLISEDKSAAGDSNLEQWALALGLVYAYRYWNESYWETNSARFGMYPRTAKEVQSTRNALIRDWGGDSREYIISTVERMTAHGHNDSFLEAAAAADSLTAEELAYLISLSPETDQYMWPYTKSLSEKWGDKGILAWDLSRMGAMVQWGYQAGRLTYEEALALVEPAARMAAESFSSWEEFYENYLDGYNWWARNNVVGQDPWETERGPLCRKMLDDPILDDALFEVGVTGLPGQEG